MKQHAELKYRRYALLKNEQNRMQKQDEIFKVIQEANLQVSVVWRLREEFKAIFECKAWFDAKQYFRCWFESEKEAAVKEILKVVEMFERHTQACVMHFAMNHPTPERSESMGRSKRSKRSAKGTENLKTSDL